MENLEQAEPRDYDRAGLRLHHEPHPQEVYTRLLDELEQHWQKGEIADPRAAAVVLENQDSEVLLQLRGSEPGLEFAGRWTLRLLSVQGRSIITHGNG